MKIALQTCFSTANPHFRAKTTDCKPDADRNFLRDLTLNAPPHRANSEFSNQNLQTSNNISFTGFICEPEDFDLKKLYGLDCPCCGKPMPTKRQLQAHVQRIEKKRGQDLQNELSKALPFYRPNEEEIANILIETSEDYPRANLQELCAILADLNKGALEAEQKKVIEEVRTEAKNLPPSKRKEVEEILDLALSQITGSTNEQHFKKSMLTGKLQGLKAKYKYEDPKEFNKLIEIANKIPNTYASKNAFFVKYQRKTSKEIAERLFFPATATTEHVKPKSKDGQNNTENYIPMCSDCNFNRGNTSYTDWFKIHPEMPENLQKFIYRIDEMIQKEEFREAESYHSYVDDIIETVREETDGTLILKKPGEIAKETETGEEETVAAPAMTLEEQRKEWEEDGKKLQGRLEVLRKRREELEADEEFMNLKGYAFESKKLLTLKTAKEKKLADLTALTRQKNRIKSAAEAAEKQGKKFSIIRNHYNKLNELTSAIEAAKTALNQANAEYEEQKQKTDEIKAKIELPQEIQAQINEIRQRVETMDSLRNRLSVLRKETEAEDEIILSLSRINGRISEIESRMKKRSETNDLNSLENQQAVSELDLLKKRLKETSGIDRVKFAKFFGKKNSDPPYYILDEAKKSIEAKIKNLQSNPAIAQLKDKAELEKCKKEKADLNRQSAVIDSKKKEIKQLNKELRALKAQGSRTYCLSEINRLFKRKDEVKFKLRNVDIDDEIQSVTLKINEVWQKYCQSFENFGYQHSNSKLENPSGSSSS